LRSLKGRYITALLQIKQQWISMSSEQLVRKPLINNGGNIGGYAPGPVKNFGRSVLPTSSSNTPPYRLSHTDFERIALNTADAIREQKRHFHDVGKGEG
jgi:hypothetical protein